MAFTIEPPSAEPAKPPPRFTIEPPAAPQSKGGFTIEAPDGSLLSRVVAGVKDFGRAVAGDVKDIASGLVETAKIPGDVIKGNIPAEKLPEAAREFAITFPAGIRSPAGGRVKAPAPAAQEGPRLGETAPPVSPEPAPAGAQRFTVEPPPTESPAKPGVEIEGAAPQQKPVAETGPLSRPPEIKNPRKFEDQLFQLRNLETDDRLDALKAVQKLPEDYTPALDEKLYHHEENPSGVPLTAREKAIYDEHVAPIKQEATALARDLERVTGVKADINDVYTPRYVAGRTRSYGESIAQWMKGVEARFGGASSRTMRKTVDAQKGRDFFIAEHPETGERTLVYVAPDQSVYSFDGTPQIKPFGKAAGAPKTGTLVKTTGGSVRLTQATTKEIEAQAQTRYIKSVMANRLDNLAKLRSAVRNANYIESLKKLPEFGDYFKPANETPVPPVTNGRTWRRPNLPQFMSYVTDPRIADALDDFMRTSHNAEGLNKALQNIGRVMNGIMFLNPKAHIDNVFNHMLVGRGLIGNIVGMLRPNDANVVLNLVKGAREVWNIGPEYRNAVKAGLSLPYSRIVAGDLHRELLTKLGQSANSNPAAWNRLANQMGYPSAKMMLQRWSQVPNRVLWAAQDVMMMSRVMELKARGIPIEKAIRTAESEIPNYRVPGQVLGTRALAELFGNPAFGRFGRYQFGRLRAYADMVKDAFARTGGIASKERMHAFDQMLMLGVYTFGVYSLYDYAWQEITGNPLAYTVRSGASAIPRAIQEAWEGRKKAGDLITSLFTLGVPIEIAGEAYTGRYGWSGQPIARDADLRNALTDKVRAKQLARDIASYAAQKLSSLGALVSPSGKETAGQTGLRAIGVISPTEEQERAKERAKRFDERNARKRAYKQENRP